MKLSEYKASINKPLKEVTLGFLVRPGEILLAMKKRGFGQNKWNGVGGKCQEGESLIQAFIREALEEINVSIEEDDLEKVAVISFYFPYIPKEQNWNQIVHIYLVKKWQNEPKESEEMKPKWFKLSDIPYEKMWWDDKYWLPLVLEGKKVSAEFMFDQEEKVVEYQVESN